MGVRPEIPLSSCAPPELRLLFACARLTLSDEQAGSVAAIAVERIDWQRFVRAAEHNGVVPLVMRNLSRHASSSVPAAAMAELRRQAAAAVANNLQLTAQLLRILDHLRRRGIIALAWKGPTLAVTAYGDIGLRTFRDLDLVVRSADVVGARRALAELGYRRHYRLSAAQERMLLRTNHEEQLVLDDQLVELHWRVAKSVHDVPMDVEGLWTRRRDLRLGPRSVPTLGNEDLVLTLCVHGSSHAWQRLIWLCDFAELMSRADVDWSYVFRSAERLGMGRRVRVALGLAQALLDAPLPPEVAPSVARDGPSDALVGRIRQQFLRTARPRGAFVAFQLEIRERFRDKASFVARAAFHLAPEDWTLVSLPEAAAPLYYLVRPIRLVGSYAMPFLLGRH